MSHKNPGYDEAQEAAEYLLKGMGGRKPEIMIVCGSGLGGIVSALSMSSEVSFNFAEIPHFPQTTVQGHTGRFVFGEVTQRWEKGEEEKKEKKGKWVGVMQGRFHVYEGHSPQQVTFPIRVAKLLEVSILVVTNASGGLNNGFQMGDIMVIKDHISLPSLTGQSPLMGPNEERFGPRFTPMTDPYDPELVGLALGIAHSKGHSYVRTGVYGHVAGPSYETRGEARLLSLVGADVVGMSTVPEVVVARHCGIRVLGLSLISNLVAKEDHHHFTTTHQDVLATSRNRAHVFQAFVADILDHLLASS